MNKPTSTLLLTSLLLAAGAGVLVWQPWPSDSAGQPALASQQPLGQLGSQSDKKLQELTAELPSEGVLTILDSEKISRERIKAPLRLPRDLSKADLSTLLNLLESPHPDGLDRAEWHELVNNICVRLRSQEDAPEGYTQALVNLAARRDDPVVCDYAIQAIGVWYPRVKHSERQQLNQALQDAISTPGHASAGTAIYAIHNLIVNNPFAADFSSSKLDHTLIELAAGNNEAVAATRMAAFHLLAIRDLGKASHHGRANSLHTEAWKVARRTAADPTQPITLRKTAIHTLGRIGGRDDRGLLNQLAGENARLAQAARPAIQHLSQ